MIALPRTIVRYQRRQGSGASLEVKRESTRGKNKNLATTWENTYPLVCAPNNDSNDLSLRCPHEKKNASLATCIKSAYSEDSNSDHTAQVCALNKYLNQPAHPRSLIKVFVLRMKNNEKKKKKKKKEKKKIKQKKKKKKKKKILDILGYPNCAHWRFQFWS